MREIGRGNGSREAKWVEARVQGCQPAVLEPAPPFLTFDTAL